MAPLSEQRLWTRDYLLGFVVLLGVYIVFVSLMTFMALYAAEQFNANDTAAGFAASAFVIGAGLVRLVIGKYLDFIGRKRVLIITLSMFVVCSLLYPSAGHFSLLILLRFIQGTAFGVITTAITSTILDLIPVSRRSEGLGYFSLTATLGMAIGPWSAVVISESASDAWVFGFTALCAAVALIAVIPMRIKEHAVTQDAYDQRWRIRGSDLLDGNVLPVAVVALIASIGYSLIMTFLPPYLVGRGMSEAASLFFLVLAVSMLAVRLFAGRTQDRYGDNAIIPGALIALALALAILAFADSVWHVALAAVVGGIGQGAAIPSLQAAGIHRTTANRIPIATSTHYLALDSGIAIGPVALGFIIPLAGYPGLYLTGAGIVLAGVVVYWFTHGRRASRPHTAPAPKPQC